MTKTSVTKSFEETRQLGFDFADKSKKSNIFALYGDLGSGKTTFVQGLARGLGIQRRIISPSFIIVRSYKISFKIQDVRFKNFYHVDLYRIGDEKEVIDLGLMELVNNPENLVAIEWPDKIENVLPDKRINVYFEFIEENKRKITFDL